MAKGARPRWWRVAKESSLSSCGARKGEVGYLGQRHIERKGDSEQLLGMNRSMAGECTYPDLLRLHPRPRPPLHGPLLHHHCRPILVEGHPILLRLPLRFHHSPSPIDGRRLQVYLGLVVGEVDGPDEVDECGASEMEPLLVEGVKIERTKVARDAEAVEVAQEGVHVVTGLTGKTSGRSTCTWAGFHGFECSNGYSGMSLPRYGAQLAGDIWPRTPLSVGVDLMSCKR